MKRFILVFGLLLAGFVAFADARSDAFAAMEKATAECQEAWNNLYNCYIMSLEEFTGEFTAEVKQTQKELWDIYCEKKAKEKEAEAVWLNIVREEIK